MRLMILDDLVHMVCDPYEETLLDLQGRPVSVFQAVSFLVESLEALAGVAGPEAWLPAIGQRLLTADELMARERYFEHRAVEAIFRLRLRQAAQARLIVRAPAA